MPPTEGLSVSLSSMASSAFDRMESARHRRGLTRRQLAASVGVSTAAIAGWQQRGVPSRRMQDLARALGQSQEWLESGNNPPDYFIMEALITGRGDVRWELVSEERRNSAWWDVFKQALIDDFRRPKPTIIIPRRTIICRWRFLSDPFDQQFSQLEESELRTMVMILGLPRDNTLIWESVVAAQSRMKFLTQGESSADLNGWRHLIHGLRDACIAYRRASRDPARRQQRQADAWNLLTKPFPHTNMVSEPLLTGEAIVPVLSACVRAAATTQILFSMYDRVQCAVEMALLTDFRQRIFTVHDVGNYLLAHRGLRMIGRKGSRDRRRKMVSHDTISEDTIRRILNHIRDDGRINLHIIDGGRRWQVMPTI